MAVISRDGQRSLYSVVVRSLLKREQAALLADQALDRKHPPFSRWRSLVAYTEVRNDSGELLIASKPQVLKLHRHRGEVTLPLVRQLQRTQHYRKQAADALMGYKLLVEQASSFCENLPIMPPEGIQGSRWRILRQDLIGRFSKFVDVRPIDFQMARDFMEGFGVSCCSFPAYGHARRLMRVHEVLYRASIHRSPPDDPNVIDCTGRPPDRYRDYFLESPLKTQLETAAAWFDACVPAIDAHLRDVEARRSLAYEQLPLMDAAHAQR